MANILFYDFAFASIANYNNPIPDNKVFRLYY